MKQITELVTHKKLNYMHKIAQINCNYAKQKTNKNIITTGRRTLL